MPRPPDIGLLVDNMISSAQGIRQGLQRSLLQRGVPPPLVQGVDNLANMMTPQSREDLLFAMAPMARVPGRITGEMMKNARRTGVSVFANKKVLPDDMFGQFLGKNY